MNNKLHPSLYPIPGMERLIYLKHIIKNTSQIIVGDYTYYDDVDKLKDFEKNVLYLFDYIGDKLIIGKFCQIAAGIKFIMNGGNHNMIGYSTYPFSFVEHSNIPNFYNVTSKGDTIIGNDVWFGNSCTMLPGVNIADGAIIGAGSVVTSDVEAYTIVAGNPARVIRKRFPNDVIEFLLKLKWWDWSIEKIAANAKYIVDADLDALRNISEIGLG